MFGSEWWGVHLCFSGQRPETNTRCEKCENVKPENIKHVLLDSPICFESAENLEDCSITQSIANGFSIMGQAFHGHTPFSRPYPFSRPQVPIAYNMRVTRAAGRVG